MSTTTKTRSKIDLRAMIGPLTKEPEPKTLEECLLEAGGFPFVARAVAAGHRLPEMTQDPCPVGTECRFTERKDWEEGQPAFHCPERASRVLATAPRWFLVGHKT